MSSFVAEFRPRSQYRQPMPPIESDGFVASFGLPPKKTPAFTGYLSPPPDTCSPRSAASPTFLCPQVAYSPDLCHSPSHSDMMISPSCDNYSKEEVFDIVSSKQLSKSRTRTVLENSILQLAETLLHGQCIDRIDGFLTISLVGDEQPIKVHLNKIYANRRPSSPGLDLEESVKLKTDNGRGGDSPSSVSGDEWAGGLAPEMCLRADARPSLSSPAMHSPRAASSDEGDHCKHVCDNMHCDTVRGSEVESLVQMKPESRQVVVEAKVHFLYAADEEEDNTERALVIDIPTSDKTETEVVDAQSNNMEVVTESEPEDVPIPTSSSSEGSSDDSDESNTSEAIDSSTDGMDTDGQGKAPGDSGSSHEPLVNPHSHSMVAKHPDGFQCKTCHEILPESDSVVKHALDKHSLYCCNFCHRTFTAKNNLKRHVRLHTGLRPYKCNQCQQEFARRDDLKGHMLRHDYNKPFRCSLCQKGYTDKACVKNHMAREHGSRRLIVCPQCGESFDNDDAFSNHKKSHPELEKFSCHDCSFIGTNKLMTMKHRLIHTHKLFSCKPCNAYFPDPFNYTSHVRTHKNQKSFSSYTCCFCDMSLSSYEQFVRHEYSHAQGKTYSCSVCSKQFNSKSSLQEHSVCHNEEERQGSSSVIDLCSEEEPMVEEAAPQRVIVAESSRPQERQNQQPIRIPTIILSEPEVQPSDNICDGVLDLSMKKSTSSPSSGATQLDVAPSSLRNIVNLSPLLSGSSELSAPRDGCTSGSPVVAMVDEFSSQRLPLFSTVERTEENYYIPIISRTSESPKVDESKLPSTIQTTESSSITAHAIMAQQRPKSTEVKYETTSKGSLLTRSLSGIHHDNGVPRFHPYKRSQIADFTKKFLAARGHQATLFKKGREVLKPVIPEIPNQEEESNKIRTPTVMASWQSRDLLDQAMIKSRAELEISSTKHERVMDTSESSIISQKTVESEQVENSQLPTFIKSEPFFDTDSSPTDSKSFISSTVPGYHHVTGSGRNVVSSSGRETTLVCEQCKEEFNSFSELESHSVQAHKRYLCEHCGKSFSARPNRDRHVRYHTGERPYKCDLCNQAFFRGDDLKYHRTTRHPTAQPFVCAGCGANFTWKKDLERHMRQSKCKHEL